MTEVDDRGRVMQAVGQIISFVEGRGYEAGERIPSERDLMARFGVGRGVIREALTVLEALRYLERRRGSGIYLSQSLEEQSLETLVLYSKIGFPLDQESLMECLEVRSIIEVDAIARACRRRTDENIEAINQVLESSRQALAEGRTLDDHDFRFHMEVFKATQNKTLVKLVVPFYLMSTQRRFVYFSDKKNGESSLKQHELMAEAIASRDVETGMELMKSHIGNVEHYFSLDSRQ